MLSHDRDPLANSSRLWTGHWPIPAHARVRRRALDRRGPPRPAVIYARPETRADGGSTGAPSIDCVPAARRGGHVGKVGIYRRLKNSIPFTDRYTDLPISLPMSVKLKYCYLISYFLPKNRPSYSNI